MRNSVAIDMDEYKKYEDNEFVRRIISKLYNIKNRQKLRKFLENQGFMDAYKTNSIIQSKINKYHRIYQPNDNKNVMMYRNIKFKIITMILPIYGFIDFEYIVEHYYKEVFAEIILLTYIIQSIKNIDDDVESFKEILKLL